MAASGVVLGNKAVGIGAGDLEISSTMSVTGAVRMTTGTSGTRPVIPNLEPETVNTDPETRVERARTIFLMQGTGASVL